MAFVAIVSEQICVQWMPGMVWRIVNSTYHSSMQYSQLGYMLISCHSDFLYMHSCACWCYWCWHFAQPPPHTHNLFTTLFPGPSVWAGARREFLDFMVQEKINRGRHTDHPAGCHSIRTNQCPPPPSPHFLQAGCPSCHPTNSLKALKASCPSWLYFTLERIRGVNTTLCHARHPL